MSENQGTTITTAAATVATTSTATSVTATTTATAAIAPVDSRIVEFVSRRRGIGKTLPVGWKPLLPPTDAVRRKIHEQIMTRRKEEERGILYYFVIMPATILQWSVTPLSHTETIMVRVRLENQALYDSSPW